jgi:glycolate oxidase iron-sulfur subunit
MLREDPHYSEKAARVAVLAKDVCEFMAGIGLRSPAIATGQRVAYHAACSLQHGQKIVDAPKRLLRAAGFSVLDVPEGHLCCGSAGTYNMLQPALAGRLKARKLDNIARTEPDLVATGNIGCIAQLQSGARIPVLHTVELLDWATGGPAPEGLG